MAHMRVVSVWRDESGLLGFILTEPPVAIQSLTKSGLWNDYLFEGDQIRAINGRPVSSMANFDKHVQGLEKFDMTVVSFWPIPVDSFILPVKVCLGPNSNLGDIGFTIDNNLVVTGVTNQKLHHPVILPGDRIVSVQGKLILTLKEFTETLQHLRELSVQLDIHFREFEIRVVSPSVTQQSPGVVNSTVRTLFSPIQLVEQTVRVVARAPGRVVGAASNNWKKACDLAQICAAVTKVSYYDPGDRPLKLFFRSATLRLDMNFNAVDHVVYACNVFGVRRQGAQEVTQLVILGYKGTDSGYDVVADAGVMLGLNDLFTMRNGEHALSPVRRVLQNYDISPIQEERDGPILVATGHSLGGSRAMLAAAHPHMREYIFCAHVFNPGCGLYDQNDTQRPGLLWTLLDSTFRFTTIGRGLGHSVRRLTGLFADVDSFLGDVHFRIHVHHTFADLISACNTSSMSVRVHTYAPRWPLAGPKVTHSMQNFRDQRKRQGPDQFEQLVCVDATFHEHDGCGAWSSGREADKAWDGNPKTFYDSAQANGGYTAADIGAARRIALIAYRTRRHYQARMLGGKFEGKKDADSSWELLYSIAETPARHPAFNYAEVINNAPFKYIRYIGPDGGRCNVADIKVFVEVEDRADPDM